MKQKAWYVAPLIVLGAALIILFYRLFIGEVLFWGLPSLQFTPWREYAVELIRSGELPLWNPYNGAGAPLFANYQSALLYPLNWLSFIFPVPQTMSLLAAAHLFIAGCGMWTFMKTLGASVLGAGIAALSFALCGYLVARLGTYPLILTAAWLPWLLWAALILLRNGRLTGLIRFTTFCALGMLGGHAQTMWYSLLLVLLFVLWMCISTRELPWRRLLGLLLGLALGVGIAALQLIPTAELTLLSQRSDGLDDIGYALNFSFAPLRLLTLLNANVFGTPADGSFVSGGAYFEDAVYIGVIPLAAAFAALILWRGKRRSNDPLVAHIPFWLIVIVIALIFAFGRYTPIYPLIYQYVPTFDLFQAPARWNLWTVFGLAAMAGIGASWWVPSRRLRRWATRLLVVCLAFVIVGIGGLLFFSQGTLPAIPVLLKAEATAGVFGVIAALLAIYQPLESRALNRWCLVVLVVVSADLVIAGWGLNPTVNAAFYDRQPSLYDAAQRAYWRDAAQEAVQFGQFFSFTDYRLASLDVMALRESNLPNLNLLDRAGLFNNFDPLLAERYFSFRSLLEAYPSEALYRAAGISLIYDQGFETLIDDVQPAYVVGAACWHPAEAEAVQSMVAAEWQPFRRVELVGEGECNELGAAPIGEILSYDDEGRRITYRADRAGWVVVSQLDYPGWEAFIDDVPVSIYTANLAFRAVPTPAGEHTLAFRYQPSWLMPGFLVSLLSIVGYAALFFLIKARPTYNDQVD